MAAHRAPLTVEKGDAAHAARPGFGGMRKKAEGPPADSPCNAGLAAGKGKRRRRKGEQEADSLCSAAVRWPPLASSGSIHYNSLIGKEAASCSDV